MRKPEKNVVFGDFTIVSQVSPSQDPPDQPPLQNYFLNKAPWMFPQFSVFGEIGENICWCQNGEIGH